MKAGIKLIITGFVLFVLGGFVMPLLFLIPLFFDGSKDIQFKVPGAIQATINKPGRYYIWNNFQTMYKGKSYNRSERIPDGLEVKIRDSEGKPLDLVCDSSMFSSVMNNSKRSIGYFEAKNAGRVNIEVSGGSDEMIFLFSPSNQLKILILLVGGFVFSTIVAFAGVGIGIWGIIKLMKATKQDKQITGSNIASPQSP